jgi:ribosome-binding protein aMBF1 (putative translation factor)
MKINKMNKPNENQLADIDNLLKEMDMLIYGVDLSGLSFQEREKVKHDLDRLKQLEAEKERRNSKPKIPPKNEKEFLIQRLEDLYQTKIERIRKGRELREIPNEDLEKELELLYEYLSIVEEIEGGEHHD